MIVGLAAIGVALDRSFAIVRPRGSDERLVHEAPAPVFARLERTDERVTVVVRVAACVAAGGGVTAADVPAAEAQPQVHPLHAGAQAVLTPLGGARRDGTDHREMGARGRR